MDFSFTWDQWVVSIFTIASIYLSQTKGLERYACWAGILAQPGWLWASWHSGQGGVFLVSVVLFFMWLKGFYSFWIKKGDRI